MFDNDQLNSSGTKQSNGSKIAIVWGWICLILGLLNLVPGASFFLWIPTLLICGISSLVLWKLDKHAAKLCLIGFFLGIAGFIFLMSIISKGF